MMTISKEFSCFIYKNEKKKSEQQLSENYVHIDKNLYNNTYNIAI